jgi:hypothetical protein
MRTFTKYISILLVVLSISAFENQTYGQGLPFSEQWTSGQFGNQHWTFTPNQGNWVMNTTFGNPAPCADFQWNPLDTNYRSSLVSTILDASAYSCADVYCDFDLKLADHFATATEKMDLDVLINGVWINKAEYADSGSFDWSRKHINISNVEGSTFQFRFRAHGASTQTINHWYVDNIEVYTICRPAQSLTGQQTQFTTTLTWRQPDCSAYCILKTYHWGTDIAGNAYSLYVPCGPVYLGNYYPIPNGASGVIKSLDIYFTSSGISSAQTCIVYFFKPDQTTIFGQSAPFINYGASWPSGTWDSVSVSDVPYTGPLYAMVDYTLTSTERNFMCVDNVSTFPAPFSKGYAYASCGGGWQFAADEFGVDPSATFIEHLNVCEIPVKDTVDPTTTIDPTNLPTFRPLGFQTGVLTAGAISDRVNFAVGSPHVHNTQQAPAGSQLLGYNVWRENLDSLAAGFLKINNTVVSDTAFLDNHPTNTPPTQHWKYYVTAEFQDSLNPSQPNPMLCEPSSDTIAIDFPSVGFNYLTGNQVTLYPNPATEIVNVVSTDEILSIDALNYLGQTIYKASKINQKTTQISVSSFRAGVYFVNVTTASGTTTMKITVTH